MTVAVALEKLTAFAYRHQVGKSLDDLWLADMSVKRGEVHAVGFNSQTVKDSHWPVDSYRRK
jgi:hypothetical protein